MDVQRVMKMQQQEVWEHRNLRRAPQVRFARATLGTPSRENFTRTKVAAESAAALYLKLPLRNLRLP